MDHATCTTLCTGEWGPLCHTHCAGTAAVTAQLTFGYLITAPIAAGTSVSSRPCCTGSHPPACHPWGVCLHVCAGHQGRPAAGAGVCGAPGRRGGAGAAGGWGAGLERAGRCAVRCALCSRWAAFWGGAAVCAMSASIQQSCAKACPPCSCIWSLVLPCSAGADAGGNFPGRARAGGCGGAGVVGSAGSRAGAAAAGHPEHSCGGATAVDGRQLALPGSGVRRGAGLPCQPPIPPAPAWLSAALPLITLPPYIALERALPCLALALQGRRGQWCVRPAAAQRPLPPLWQAPPRRGRQ